MKAILILYLVLFASVLFAYDIRIDLSGKWIPERATDPTEHIEQKGADVKIETLGPKGEVLSTLVLSADGLERTNVLEGGKAKHFSVTLWEGNKLVTTWKLERDGRVFQEGKDERELSEDEMVQTLKRRTVEGKTITDVTIVMKKK